MYEEYKKDHPIVVTDDDILAENAGANRDAKGDNQPTLDRKHKSKNGITVNGLFDVSVRFSKCCSPVPGDEIVGFVTRGRGVSIHRTDCINMMNLPEIDKRRLIEAEWSIDGEENAGGLYLTEINIYGNNRKGLLVDISRIFTESDIDINTINSKTSKQGVATINVTFRVRTKDDLRGLVEKLRQVESVVDVERTTG
jgi:GTP pyrophosphokinase